MRIGVLKGPRKGRPNLDPLRADWSLRGGVHAAARASVRVGDEKSHSSGDAYCRGSRIHSTVWLAQPDEDNVPGERAANAFDRRLGQRVRARRLEIGMSQERLAGLLDVTFQQVQKYEKGVNRIAASRLFDISAALDLSLAKLFEGMGAAKTSGASSAIDHTLATSEGIELAALFASIKSQEVRRRVVELVRSLSEG